MAAEGEEVPLIRLTRAANRLPIRTVSLWSAVGGQLADCWAEPLHPDRLQSSSQVSMRASDTWRGLCRICNTLNTDTRYYTGF